MTTLEEYWASTTAPKPRKTPKPKKALQRCADCGLQSWGARCRRCQLNALRPPLDPCTTCGTAMHRTSTPVEDRAAGSVIRGTRGLCSTCTSREARVAKGVTSRGGRGKGHGRKMRAVLPVPSPDSSPLTFDEELQAACAQSDADAWFPEQGEKATDPKRVCEACPIQARCLAVALAAPKQEEGIWGGTSKRERAKMLEQRAAAAA